MTGDAGLRAAIGAALADLPAGPVGVAVSGGSDSTALAVLLAHWTSEAGRRLEAVTVDHRLRPESAAEAAMVAQLCARLGIPHAVRVWEEGPGRGNLQDSARTARQRLIAGWAAERGIGMVALGHTLDDQAETFLMRLARGSGVHGLAAMAPRVRIGGLVWLRPLLGLRRGDLRDWLSGQGIGWADDPSNENDRFDRVRARAALGPLAGLGLGAERLAATAAAMARARVALEAAAAGLADAALDPGPAGDVLLDPARFAPAPEELRLRVLAGTLAWVSGARWRPRLASLTALDAWLRAGPRRGVTLHGCVLRPWRGSVAIRREPARVAGPIPAGTGVWDGRWEFTGLARDGATVGALGRDGLRACPDWSARGIARETLLSSPALRSGGRLVAAPLAGLGDMDIFRRISGLEPPWMSRYCVESAAPALMLGGNTRPRVPRPQGPS